MQLLPALVCLFAAASLAAQNSSLSGTILAPSGLPIAGAEVLLDAGAFSATTDPAGQFVITGLSNRSYVVQIDPIDPFVAPREQTFVVSGAAQLGTVALQPGAPVTGTFVNGAGTLLSGCNLNAYLPDGTKLFTPRDGTDAQGFAQITVPLTAVTLEAVPPVGAPLFAWRADYTVAGPLALGTVTLPQSYTISGTVVRSGVSPLPIANCRVLVTDQFTELEVPLVNNLTNALGAFSVALPFGLYRFDFVPATGNLHTPRQFFGVIAAGQSVNLGFVPLDPAVVLSGTVSGPSGLIASADVDVFDALGHKLFTPNDNTNATGAFSVRVPTGGSYAVRIDPLPTAGLSGKKVDVGLVTAARNLGTLTLTAGIPITLDLFDLRGQPIVDLNMRLRDPLTGQEQIVPGNNTDVNGRMVAIVPPGVFDVTLRPPQGSDSAPVTVPSVPFVSPFSVPLTMPDKIVRTDLTGYPTLGVSNGGDILLEWSVANLTAATRPTTIEAFVLLESGVEVAWVPPLPIDLPAQFAIGLQFWLATPPLAAAELRWEQRFQVRIRDAATQAVLDEAYVYYFPR